MLRVIVGRHTWTHCYGNTRTRTRNLWLKNSRTHARSLALAWPLPPADSRRPTVIHSCTHAHARHARIGWRISLIVPTISKPPRATATVSCANCQSAMPKALTCKRCKATKYCTKECQVMRRKPPSRVAMRYECNAPSRYSDSTGSDVLALGFVQHKCEGTPSWGDGC